MAPIPYDAHAQCPRFLQFLRQVFVDQTLIDFIRVAVGYTLMGAASEQVFIVLVGSGANGKGTFLRALRGVLGEYAVQASMESFLVQRTDASRPREDIAALRAARLVIASEVGEDRLLDEATVKHLTGGDPVRARRLYGHEFEFTPMFVLWMDTNHLPRIRGTDDGIWRRILPVEMKASFRGDRADRSLDRALEAERPGVLAWMVRGATEWARDGLRVPSSVERSRQRYRGQEDTVGAFLDDCAERVRGSAVVSGRLFDVFDEWCRDSGSEPMSQTAFGRRLTARGHGTRRHRGDRVRLGLRLPRHPEVNRNLEEQRNLIDDSGTTDAGTACAG